MERSLARILIIVGLSIAMLGILVLVAGRIPWLGRLPGDLRIHRGGTWIYFPIVTSILLSIVLTLLLNLFARK